MPGKLEDIINKALEKDLNLRYQHASEMMADLKRLVRDTTSGMRAAVSSQSVTLPAIEQAGVTRTASPRSVWMVMAAGAAVVVAAVVFFAGRFLGPHSAAMAPRATIAPASSAILSPQPTVTPIVPTTVSTATPSSAATPAPAERAATVPVKPPVAKVAAAPSSAPQVRLLWYGKVIRLQSRHRKRSCHRRR